MSRRHAWFLDSALRLILLLLPVSLLHLLCLQHLPVGSMKITTNARKYDRANEAQGVHIEQPTPSQAELRSKHLAWGLVPAGSLSWLLGAGGEHCYPFSGLPFGP